ncbi:MAG TPA: hypothetical protein PKH07_01080 [bacterium]|nr:hypothetical protein [bacterium]
MRWTWVAVVLLGLVVMGWSAAAQSSDLEAQVKKMQEQIEKQQAQLQALQEALESESKERKSSLSEIKSLQLQTDRIKIGGDIRLRGVSFHDVWDMGTAPAGLPEWNDSWDFYRFRNRLWFDVNLGEADIAEEIRGYIRLVNEYRWGDTPDSIYTTDGETNTTKQIEIDNAYIELKYIANTCVSLKLGRQDLIYGEGFLILDGTPWDGSRTIGFDAIKATLDFDHTIVDVFMAKVFENDRGQGDDENLLGVYATNKELLNGHTIEAYVLHQDNNEQYYTGHPTAGRGKLIPSFNVTTVGTRLSGKLTDNLKYAGEIAGQWGNNNSAYDSRFGGISVDASSDNAIGGYLNGTYCMNDLSLKPELTAGFTYLGEGWKSMYGNWPKYSELLIYTFYDGFDYFKPTNTDPTVGTWTNMMFPSVAMTVKPTEKMTASLGYRYLIAVDERSNSELMFDSGGNVVDGDNIGSLVQAMVKYQFTKNLSSHALIEYFSPGDYYPDYFNDAYFARWELMLSF